jgi:hypothetical protein
VLNVKVAELSADEYLMADFLGWGKTLSRAITGEEGAPGRAEASKLEGVDAVAGNSRASS